MKTIRNILCFILSFSCATLSAQNIDFNKLEKMEGVSSVYISKTMLQMMPDIDVRAEGVDIGKLAGRLESIQILSSENEAASLQLKTAVSVLAKDENYEELIRMKENRNFINIYIRKEKDQITEMVMLSEGKDKFSIIRITGKLDIEDLQKIKPTVK